MHSRWIFPACLIVLISALVLVSTLVLVPFKVSADEKYNTIIKTDNCGNYCECSDGTICNPKRLVLFLYGISDSKANVETKPLYSALTKNHKVYIIDYNSGPGNAYEDIRTYAQYLDSEIKRIRNETNSEKVDIVAHSMGGLISRYRIQNIPGGEDDVGKLIMIGTPNHGSVLSERNTYCSNPLTPSVFTYCIKHTFNDEYRPNDPYQALNAMYPGSKFLFELNNNHATSEDVAKGGVLDKISNKVKYYVIAGNSFQNGDWAVKYDSAKLSEVPIYTVTARHDQQFESQEVTDKVIELLALDDSTSVNNFA